MNYRKSQKAPTSQTRQMLDLAKLTFKTVLRYSSIREHGLKSQFCEIEHLSHQQVVGVLPSHHFSEFLGPKVPCHSSRASDRKV